MIKLFETIKNIFSIEELRDRIINTVGFLIIFRLGSFVVLPGIDPSKLQQSAGGIFGLLDTFLGGAFSNASIFALGIMDSNNKVSNNNNLYVSKYCISIRNYTK